MPVAPEAWMHRTEAAVMDLTGLFSDKVSFDVFYLSGPDYSKSARMADRRSYRFRQFSATRVAASRLLRNFGETNTQLARLDDGSPDWPPGIVGSISHSANCIFIAIARREDVRALGIDVETVISPEVRSEIGSVYMNKNEMSLMGDEGLAPTICFFAKESLFKCIYPITKRYFGYEDAEVTSLDYQACRPSIRLVSSLSNEFLAGTAFEGSFRYDERNVFTALELARM
jgi:enterobactin synthetase component D